MYNGSCNDENKTRTSEEMETQKSQIFELSVCAKVFIRIHLFCILSTSEITNLGYDLNKVGSIETRTSVVRNFAVFANIHLTESQTFV